MDGIFGSEDPKEEAHQQQRHLKRLKRHQDNQATPSTSDSAPKQKIQPLRVWPLQSHPGSGEIQGSGSSQPNQHLSLSLIIPKDESFTDDVTAPLAVIPPAAGQIPLRCCGKEPTSSPLLYMQANHKSAYAYKDTKGDSKFRAGKMWPIDDRTSQIVNRAGFLHAGLTSRVEIDHGLMHALVERWRPETHSFHLPHGEMTITLKDVAMILGLRIDGPPITDHYRKEIVLDPELTWKEHTLRLFEEMFGVRPPPSKFKKGSLDLQISWLKVQFMRKPNTPGFETNNYEEAERRARAYILCLLGTCLFSDSNGSTVPLQYIYYLRDLDACSRYSWASAVLGYLYRGMCRWTSNKEHVNITGCGVLVQVWCWQHISIGRPKCLNNTFESGYTVGCWWKEAKTSMESVVPRTTPFYRDQLKPFYKQTVVSWNPWNPDVTALMPPIALEGWELATIQLPLIHFNCVEFQQPQRVSRQLGLGYSIPDAYPNRQEWDNLHRFDTWMKTPTTPWYVQHEQYIEQWSNRNERTMHPLPKPVQVEWDEYIRWYARNTVDLVGSVEQQSQDEEQQPAEIRPSQGYLGEYGNQIQYMTKEAVLAWKQGRKSACGNGPPKERGKKVMEMMENILAIAGLQHIIRQLEDEDMSDCSIEDEP